MSQYRAQFALFTKVLIEEPSSKSGLDLDLDLESSMIVITLPASRNDLASLGGTGLGRVLHHY